MSTNKTEWVELQVTMPKALRDLIHEAHRILGTKASGWGREIILAQVPELVRRAEHRSQEIQALFTRGNSTGSRAAGGVRKPAHAVATKARQAEPAAQGQARKAPARRGKPTAPRGPSVG